MGRMRNLMVLGGSVRRFRSAAGEGWVGDISRRQRLVGTRDPGGASRHLFGAGEGPIEAEAGAKQNQAISASHGWIGKADRPWPAGESGSWEPVLRSLESASFLRHSPVVNHLSVTCSATCQPAVILVFDTKTLVSPCI